MKASKPEQQLEKEFQYYLDHQDELVKEYNGKVIVIKDQQVIGVYESDIEAVIETEKEHPLGTFLVQLCSEGDTAHTQHFISRVSFA